MGGVRWVVKEHYLAILAYEGEDAGGIDDDDERVGLGQASKSASKGAAAYTSSAYSCGSSPWRLKLDPLTTHKPTSCLFDCQSP